MPLDIMFHNIDLKFDDLKAKYQEKLALHKEPVFSSYKEDIPALQQALKPYIGKYETIILNGNGGSIWSFMPFYTALADRVHGKNVVLLTDMEPDNIAVIKSKYPVGSALVVTVSKSGSTVGTIENLFVFSEYDQLYVTDPESTLGKIGKARQVPMLVHPAVGGRYSSFTACAYVPAFLTDLPVEEIEKGGREAYGAFGDVEAADNVALEMALYLYELEQQGYTEMFLPIYSNFLQTFGMIATQLFHESFGKAGQGITVLAAQAPESQHHTNQRFFGGRKNMVGCFLHVVIQKDSASRVEVPAELLETPLRTGTLADINGVRLADSFKSEYIGTFTDAQQQGIPVVDIAVSEVSGHSCGELMAFWHYVTVYGALLRGVDPFDQPQVEASKVISFEQRRTSH